jgi:hypothetical protein
MLKRYREPAFVRDHSPSARNERYLFRLHFRFWQVKFRPLQQSLLPVQASRFFPPQLRLY